MSRDRARLADLDPLEARITKASRLARQYRCLASKAQRQGGEEAAKKQQHFAQYAIQWDLELAEAQLEAGEEGLPVKRGPIDPNSWRSLEPLPRFKQPIPGGELYLQLLSAAAA